ncbi:phospholipase D family protein [Noviherbaspirillum sp. ST9]|uniref:phospholipase D family nuclease n=1 Tax=Noviherbaspirillum sp. ST9 TaxID=3401606 RepID=UPI003B58A8EA
MIRRALVASLIFTLAALSGAAHATGVPLPAQGSLQPLFAPWDDVESAVIDVVVSARKQVLVQAYLLTSKKIATTLIAAHRRGVEVRVLVDGGQLEKVPSSMAADLSAAGVPVWIETRYQNAHNKLIIVDAGSPAATVITGSFNFTWTAQHKNAENILIARNNPALATRYAENWERHRLEATPFKK